MNPTPRPTRRRADVASPGPVIRAAAVVIERPTDDGDHEVLLVRRGMTNLAGRPMAFAGAWVFPGGKIDGEESPVAAAVREATEEVGLELAPEELMVLWELTSTARDGRSFSTVYLRGPVPPNAQPVPAPGELQDCRWVTTAAALRAAEASEMELPPATRTTLERLNASGGHHG